LVPELTFVSLLTIVDEDFEKDDYVICSGYDPDTNSYATDIPVAKPWLLQRTPFEGRSVIRKSLDGDFEVTYEYIDIGLRLATAIIDGEEVQELQRITEDYQPGEDLACIRTIIGQGETNSHTGWQANDGQSNFYLQWLDLNFSGRAWAVTDEELEE